VPGKSATGRTKKIGYYEHSWATKRDSTLSKKILRCEPHRIPSAKLEPVAWEKLTEFVTDSSFVARVLEKVRAHHAENPHRKEMERFRAKIMGVNSQLDALSERLAEIPKGVSAGPIYKQMEKLQMANEEHEAGLETLRSAGNIGVDRVIGLDTFEDFASLHRKFVMGVADVKSRKQLIQKFIRRVEVDTDSFRIHFIVDKEHYQRELKIKDASPHAHSGSRIAGSEFFGHCGSNTLTFGAPGRT